MGHCHHLRGIHKLMRLLLDSKTRQSSKVDLKLVMNNATIRTTVILYDMPHQTGKLAERSRRQTNSVHKLAPRTVCMNARSVTSSSKSATFSSLSMHPIVKLRSH